jgi:protoporphyrinogen oxidase
MDGFYECVVAGGGISGLAAAQALKEQRCRWLVLEACPTLGGLTRSIEIGDFCFDYTGHFLHLRHYETPAAIPFANLVDDDWQRIKRRSRCLLESRLITAPVQYHLGELPPKTRERCVKSYQERTKRQERAENTFRDYLVNGFGASLAELFLIPQNEKTLAIPVHELSVDAVKRFFPVPDEDRILAGLRADPSPSHESSSEYNSEFWYPKLGGIGGLAKGLSEGLENILLNQEVVSVDLQRRSLQTATGEVFRWDSLLFSLPLKSFCQITNEQELVRAGEQLSHSSTVSFSLGLKGEPPPSLRDTHWIYVPDVEIPFYRVGFYSNISSGNCSPGYSSLYVECGFPGGEAARVDITGELQSKVLRHLERLGWLDPNSIVCLTAHVIPCAYVHHTPTRAALVEEIFQHLQGFGVYPIGRYGLWDYINMEDSIDSGLSTANRLFGSG